MDENATHIIFHGTPNNTQFGNFTITLTLDDGHDDVNDTDANFTLCVTENQEPELVGTPDSASNGQVGFDWQYEFTKAWMNEVESETLTFTCSVTPDNGWMSCTQNATHIKFSGKPVDNAHAVEYELQVLTADVHSDVSDHNFTTNMTIIPNDPPVIGTMESHSLLAPDGLTWSYGANLITDPESLSFNVLVQFDGSSLPSWVTFESSTNSFAVITSDNSYVGVHNISYIATDDYNSPVVKNFTLAIVENFAPQIKKFISNAAIVNFNYLYVKFLPVDELFEDPDNRTMTASITQYNGDPLPSFLSYNQINNDMYGTPDFVHVGDWILTYVATDDHNLTNGITFTLTVKP